MRMTRIDSLTKSLSKHCDAKRNSASGNLKALVVYIPMMILSRTLNMRCKLLRNHIWMDFQQDVSNKKYRQGYIGLITCQT